VSEADKVKRAFLPISKAVDDFATELAIDKGARGNAGWELTGDHDRGGTFFLLLLYDELLGLGIGSVWQFPCVETSLLYSHFRPVRPCALDPAAVTTALDCEMKALAQVPFGHWTHVRPLHPPGT
jgi:hypothetical protein